MNSLYRSSTPANKKNYKPDFHNNEHIVHSNTNSNFNTYTNVDYWQNSTKSIRSKPQIPNKNYQQFHTFLRTSAPFNYFTGKDGYVIHYNGGLIKELRPLVTRDDLAKYLRYNGSLVKKNRQKFPKNYKLNSFSSKPYRTNDYCYYYRQNDKRKFNRDECPFINERYQSETPNNCFSPKNQCKYKLKTNFNNYNEQVNNMAGDEGANVNFSGEINGNNRYKILDEGENKNEKVEENVNMNRRVLSENEQGLKSKRDQMINNFNYTSYSVRPEYGRCFHKVQIFNNYKPYLVDEYRAFGDYIGF